MLPSARATICTFAIAYAAQLLNTGEYQGAKVANTSTPQPQSTEREDGEGIKQVKDGVTEGEEDMRLDDDAGRADVGKGFVGSWAVPTVKRYRQCLPMFPRVVPRFVRFTANGRHVAVIGKQRQRYNGYMRKLEAAVVHMNSRRVIFRDSVQGVTALVRILAWGGRPVISQRVNTRGVKGLDHLIDVSIKPDGKRLVTGSLDGGLAVVRNVTPPFTPVAELRDPKCDGEVVAGFSPEGERVVTLCRLQIKDQKALGGRRAVVWNVTTLQPITTLLLDTLDTLRADLTDFTHFDWSPDGKRVALTIEPDFFSEVYDHAIVYDAFSGEVVQRLGLADKYYGIKFVGWQAHDHVR